MNSRVMVTALSALANVSREAVGEADLRRMLSTGDGPGHLVRALFGDCSSETLDRLAASFGLSRETVVAAYRRARTLHAASNPDFGESDGEGYQAAGQAPAIRDIWG